MMPFVYYGGKKALARYYPPPKYPVIIEPFAGSAGYALHWSKPGQPVILIERDPAVVALWRRLQAPDAVDDLLSIRCPRPGRPADDPLLALTVCGEAVGGRWRPTSDEPFIAAAAAGVGGLDAMVRATGTEPLLALAAGPGAGVAQAFRGEEFVVTERMARDWEGQRNRLIAAVPIVRGWTIIEGDYTAAENRRATWFIDPPYWVPADGRGTRGDGYRFGADGIDYAALADWCQARRGQVIVCEQDGADWLPFRPFRQMTTAAGDGGRRMEVVWTRGEEMPMPRTRAQRDDAARRRSARMNRRAR